MFKSNQIPTVSFLPAKADGNTFQDGSSHLFSFKDFPSIADAANVPKTKKVIGTGNLQSIRVFHVGNRGKVPRQSQKQRNYY